MPQCFSDSDVSDAIRSVLDRPGQVLRLILPPSFLILLADDGEEIQDVGQFGARVDAALRQYKSGELSKEFGSGENTNSLVLANIEEVVIARYNHLSTRCQGTFDKFVVVRIIAHYVEITRDLYGLRHTT